MLQKYHPHPLSHFLALHNSQATHNHVVDAHTLATTIANSQFHHHHQQQQHNQQQGQPSNTHHQHTQLQQHHHQQQTAAATLLAANQHHQSTHHIQLTAHNLNSHTSPTHPPSPNHIPANQVYQHTTTNLRHHHHHNHQHQHHHLQHQHPHQHHHHQHQHHPQNTSQLIEAAASTTLDAGKSFTIAAILGLQKSAMENTCKEYANNVINLSLNGGCSHNSDGSDNGNTHHRTHPFTTEQLTKEELHLHQRQPPHTPPNHPGNPNNNSNNTNRDVTNVCHTFNHTSNSNSNNNNNNNNTNTHNITSASNASIASSVNSNTFNCDNATAAAAATVLMNRYLPTAMVHVAGSVGVVGSPAKPVLAHQHQHSRANSFVAAAAAAAAAAAGVPGGPSALQSLQQLHQQHAAHQTNLNFQREKLKSESSAKKSSLKNKRVRTIFTPEQLERLEAEFERQQYMVGPERLYLAHTLQLTEAQVKVWFQNRRIKWRKHHLEMTQQRLALLRQTQVAPVSGNDEQAPVKIDVNDDDEDFNDIKREDLRDLNDSRQDTESELSICNDSMDAESIGDDDET